MSSSCGGGPQTVLILHCTSAGGPYRCAHAHTSHVRVGTTASLVYRDRAMRGPNVTSACRPDQPKVIVVSHLPINPAVCTSEYPAGRPSPMANVRTTIDENRKSH